MNKRIKCILGFMTICIIGLILTQFFWLYKDYKFYSSQPLFSNQYDFLMPTMDSTQSIGLKKYAKAVPALLVSKIPAQGDTAKSIIAYPKDIPAVVKKLPSQTYRTTTYTAPSSYIIEKMKWQFGGSILLVLMISSCLILMLVTIYMQRKVSLVKSDFINNMTHELKTPLATVAVAVEAMRSFGALEDTSKTQLYLNISKIEIDHLSKLIEMILQQSMFDPDRMQLKKKSTDTNLLLKQLTETYQLSHPDFEFTLNTDTHTPELLLDPIHISNAVRNLIDNAIKYADDERRITITSSFRESSWNLEVADQGMGIPKIYHKEIFERFFRIPGKHSSSIKGFGLGLSYVKQIVELHKGTIALKSDEGNTFIICIPFKNL